MSYNPAAGGGGITTINAATDTSFAALASGNHMSYNAGTGKWHNASPVTLMNDMSDVNTAGLSTNDVLTFGGATWGPAAPAGGGSSATVTTMDATVTTLFTTTLAVTSAYIFQVSVACRSNTGSLRSGYRRTVMAYREGGGAVLGTVQSDYTDESDATLDGPFDVSGNDLSVRITGKAGTTVHWAGLLETTNT